MVTREVTTVSFVHLVQEEKSTLVTFGVLKKLGPRIREVRLLQSSNSSHRFVTMEVSKLERLREVRLEQE